MSTRRPASALQADRRSSPSAASSGCSCGRVQGLSKGPGDGKRGGEGRGPRGLDEAGPGDERGGGGRGGGGQGIMRGAAHEWAGPRSEGEPEVQWWVGSGSRPCRGRLKRQGPSGWQQRRCGYVQTHLKLHAQRHRGRVGQLVGLKDRAGGGANGAQCACSGGDGGDGASSVGGITVLGLRLHAHQ